MPTLEEETSRFVAAWMQVRQMVQASNFNRFQREGLSATQFMTLNVVPKEGMTLTGLARRLNLSPATLNATVNSLEERGLMQRKPHPRDARKVILSATSQGEQMQNAASQEFHAFIASLFAQMDQSGREGLLAGLEQMVRLYAATQHSSQPESSSETQTPEAPNQPPTQKSRHQAATRRADAAPPAKRSSRRSPPR